MRLYKNFNIDEFFVFDDTGSSVLSLNDSEDLIEVDTANGRVIRQMTSVIISFKGTEGHI